jgi:peptidase M28-like protein
MSRLVLAPLALLAAMSGCAREAAVFSEENAMASIRMLAETIGNRPIGTPANAQARAYIIDQLRLFGFDVRVQETDARRSDLGQTARVSNIIAVRRGARDESVGLVSHYDSAPESPGAADDGFGVAVTLEAARVLAARTDRQWSLMVLVTDGEEAGLMGAAALMTDPEVRRRLQTYINVEAIGSNDPVMLFETGPGNDWLTKAWAMRAPHPRGGSFGIEIYKRLPNDTDFSILKRHDIPGLNFAVVGDSYGYHTARDTADRIPRRVIGDAGENIVSVVIALGAIDITSRSQNSPTFFDIGGTSALSYGPGISLLIAAIALAAGVIAWVRVTAAAFRMGGVLQWLLAVVWTVLGATLVVGAMIGTTVALRAAREVYHPWYARPDRLFLLLFAVGTAVGWGVARLGRFLPTRLHGLRHPATTWSIALPVWILLGSASLWLAPGAAYLWILPLVTAGLLLSITPSANDAFLRATSVIVLGVTATLWLRTTVELLRFMVAVFGRFPIITPPYIYAALMALSGVMLVPPFVGATARTKPLLRPALMTAVLLIAITITAGLAYTAPGYTSEQPLRRRVRALQPADGAPAVWEVGSVEPGLDLAATAPAGWQLVTGAPPVSMAWGSLRYPFVFRTAGPSLGEAPAAIAAFSTTPVADGIEMTLTVVPREPGLWVSFVLPSAVIPARSNMPGVPRLGRWTATYIAPPAEGVTFRASFRGVPADVLRTTRVGITASGFPGWTGWQRLPAWLPQERTVWTATATWDLPAAAPALAPVPPLR